MLTLNDFLMGREVEYPLTDEQLSNAHRMLGVLTALEQLIGIDFKIVSGYRPPAINARIAGAAPKSKHMDCLAADINDPAGAIAFWCLNNLEMLAKLGLWMEHPDYTDGWVHLQGVAPKSGRRVFRP